MRRPFGYRLIDEIVLVDGANKQDALQRQPGKVLTVSPESSMVLIEFSDGNQGEYKKEELLHLYPKQVIMQSLVSNFEMSPENFKTILHVTRLITQRRNAEALQLAVSNEQVKFFCTTDCKSWLELRGEAHRKKRDRQYRKK